MATRSVYCICGEPYDSVRFMIQCDICKDWYHGSCVNVKEHEALDIEKYHCVQCQPVCGPSIFREIRNWHRHDYGDENADGKAVQSGTPVFVKELRSRHFPSAEDVLIRLRGPLLSLPYLMQNGFNFPILVDSKVGLGLQMPSDTFTVGDVMDYVGPNFSLDVIDVTRQENIRMTMQEWVEYFNSPVRSKVYNVISLEFSQTRLAELVKPPAIVQKLSWVENYWPKMQLPVTFLHVCPQVMKYCLMSTQDSYTDFHIDFGGTSVWYHVLRGEKVFYLIRPTPANLALYEHWMASSNQSETFFGDQVDVCYQFILTQGQTLFIPTGWIHAVFTPLDSLVFGGNFLHSLNIPLQLQIHEMERRISTPEKYKFPSFEAVHWFAAPHILEQLKDYNVSKRELQHLASGAKALVAVLKAWSTDIQNHQQQSIPPGTNVSKLIKDLQREVRIAEKYANGKSSTITVPKKTPQRQRKPKEINIKFSPTKVSVEGEKNGSSALKFSIKPRVRVNSETPNQYNQMETNFTAADLEAMDTSLQLSKEYDDRLNASYNIAIPLVGNPSLKGGTISEGNGLFKSSPSRIPGQDEFSPIVKKESVYDFVDSDEDNLVVDENPPNKRQKMADLRRQNRPQDLADMKGSIKLRLSINNKPLEGENAIPNDVEAQASEDGSADIPKNATIDDLLVATGLAVDAENTSISLDDVELSGGRTSPSTREAIQGMLSISKSAFLFANQADSSGVCSPPPAAAPPPAPSRVTETGAVDLSSSMPLPLMDSSLANFSILAKKSSPPVRTNHYPTKMTSRPSRYNNEDDDFEESLKQCHQDGDFIYLGLEASDDECHVFKPRGRSKRDEPWNPKAKLIPNCPKPERPVREGVKKEAIECGLAAAAAKLANMPPPKRQYLKKKSPVTKSKETASEPLPGPSTSVPGATIKRPLPDPVKSNKKPKKGFATAKQRLGKILKIHKMLY